VKESRVSGDGGVWQDPPGAPPPTAAGAARAPAPAPPGGLDGRCAPGGLVLHPGPRACGVRGVRSGPGAMTGESTPCPAVTARRPLSPAGRRPVPAVRLCVLWETPQPPRSQGQAAGIRLLPVLRHRRVSLWRGAGLSQYPGTDGSARPGRLAASRDLTGTSGAVGRGIPTPTSARRLPPATGPGDGRRATGQAATGTGTTY
jgi:hypothetical protein